MEQAVAHIGVDHDGTNLCIDGQVATVLVAIGNIGRHTNKTSCLCALAHNLLDQSRFVFVKYLRGEVDGRFLKGQAQGVG